MERLGPGRLVLLRTDGRADFGVALRGRETVGFGLAVDDFGLAGALAALAGERLAVGDFAAVDRTAVRRVGVLGLLALGFAVDALGLAAGRRVVVAAAGLIADMVLAAVWSALAAFAMAFVAVFMDRIADDMVFADVVALVAAAVILVAAEVTLVAAVDTVFAAATGVAELLPGPRVERDAGLRVDREAGFRGVVDEAVPGLLGAVARGLFGLALLTDLAVIFGRLAVPDALRLTDLLRAVLAGLRRVAARVVVLTGTEFSPRLDQLRWCYSTYGSDLHSRRLFPEDNEPQDVRNRRAD